MFWSLAMILAAAQPENCWTIADFSDPEEARRWQVVNDGVMGGRSVGEAAIRDGALYFAGTINTNGGGFSSLRRSLDPGALDGAGRIRVTMQGDGRDYQLSMRSDVAWRGRPVAYRGSLDPLGVETGWQVASVKLSDNLDTSIFGRTVRAPTFEPAAAREIGIILADGQDGDFAVRIKRIEACK
ncbi:CIA30 family protein [Sphingomicrobium sediminis]|uniref:CIA30 family protein n=1 Tax=Sphingomicrobium sediminis TaxID=2950949 RepID=A0A9X2J364_9SPHN|nr:CIA30 family protein [Sphingomicrobium sediminis]MCM8557755.1 CIA30 family protein [Sphingomicrobium sediminis]